eukprot:3012432-Rhodomonas_salina.2
MRVGGRSRTAGPTCTARIQFSGRVTGIVCARVSLLDFADVAIHNEALVCQVGGLQGQSPLHESSLEALWCEAVVLLDVGADSLWEKDVVLLPLAAHMQDPDGFVHRETLPKQRLVLPMLLDRFFHLRHHTAWKGHDVDHDLFCSVCGSAAVSNVVACDGGAFPPHICYTLLEGNVSPYCLIHPKPEDDDSRGDCDENEHSQQHKTPCPRHRIAH